MKVTQEFTFGFNRESNKKIRNEVARELYDRYMVMPKLFEALTAEGIPEQYFQPAYSKNRKILAYELVNKKFYKIVKKYVPDAQFFPVFLKEDE